MIPKRRIPIMTSVVMMGRRIQISERFIATLPPSHLRWTFLRRALRHGRTAGRLARTDHDARSGRETQLAVRDHGFTGLEAAPHHREIVLRVLDLDGTHRNGGIGLDDVDVWPLLPLRHRLGWDHERALGHIEDEADVHELSRHEAPVQVRELPLEEERAAHGIHGIVDEDELPLAWRTAGRTDLDARPGAEMALQERHVALGDREAKPGSDAAGRS
jgi:hypothetical protein